MWGGMRLQTSVAGGLRAIQILSQCFDYSVSRYFRINFLTTNSWTMSVLRQHNFIDERKCSTQVLPYSACRMENDANQSNVIMGQEAPLARRRWTMSLWPSRAAQCSGVSPSRFAMFGSAPLSRRSWTTSLWSVIAARCSGVSPYWFAMFGSAPLSRRSFTTTLWPSRAAQCSGVSPWCSLLL